MFLTDSLPAAELTYGILDRLRRLGDDRGHRVALAYLPTLSEARSGELPPLAALLTRYATENAITFVQTAAAAHAVVPGSGRRVCCWGSDQELPYNKPDLLDGWFLGS